MLSEGVRAAGAARIARYARIVEELLTTRRRWPFLAFGAVGVVACVVIVALPDSLLVQMERNRALDSGQAGWAYRLLVLFALVAAAFTMFGALLIWQGITG